MAKVLIVDDIAENIQILALTLSSEYDVIFATNGFDAIEIAKNEQPDIIILDIMMPEINGYDVCRELKAFETTKDIPIIFATAINEEQSEILGLELGAIDYITKPISPNLIKARIKNYINLKKAQETLLKLNGELKNQINEESEKRILLEKLMVEQSRLASMGEMIGVISHQWKQPLNIIALIIQSLKDAKEYNELDDDKINEIEFEVLRQIEFMSTTIADFKNFFSPSKEKREFELYDSIQAVKRLLNAQFYKNGITLTITCSEIHSTIGYPNEFKQAIYNILTNSKDVFLEKKIKNPLININISSIDDKVLIDIIDNGGGIDESFLPKKLFESYTSTKGSQGTGIGLHITKKIIEDSMNGKISASNIENGAKFTIELPNIS